MITSSGIKPGGASGNFPDENDENDENENEDKNKEEEDDDDDDEDNQNNTKNNENDDKSDKETTEHEFEEGDDDDDEVESLPPHDANHPVVHHHPLEADEHLVPREPSPSLLMQQQQLQQQQQQSQSPAQSLSPSPLQAPSPPPQRMRIVLKVGTSSLLIEESAVANPPMMPAAPVRGRAWEEGRGGSLLAMSVLARTVEVACKLRRAGNDVVLVSSGAVGVGCHVLGLSERPKQLSTRQALASVGQVHLMSRWEMMFSSLGQPCSQVLLTYDNLGDRSQYLSARTTFEELFQLGIIPIVNENDTVAIHELKFGDNDRLSAMVASLVSANWLFLLTDVNGLYTGNPNADPSAKYIPIVSDVRELMSGSAVDTSVKGSDWGTGGMATKVSAAEIATASGVRTVVMASSTIERVVPWVEEEYAPSEAESAPHTVDKLGTLFIPRKKPVRGRKRWIKGLVTQGTIVVDTGAAMAVAKRRSLFAAGVKQVEGNFKDYDCVEIKDEVSGNTIGVGLVNFSSRELRKIAGKRSSEASRILGYDIPEFVIERSNLVCGVPKPKGSSSSSNGNGNRRSSSSAKSNRARSAQESHEINMKAAAYTNADAMLPSAMSSAATGTQTSSGRPPGRTDALGATPSSLLRRTPPLRADSANSNDYDPMLLTKEKKKKKKRKPKEDIGIIPSAEDDTDTATSATDTSENSASEM